MSLSQNGFRNLAKLASVHSYRTRSFTNENSYVEQVRTESIKRAYFRCFNLEQYSTFYQFVFVFIDSLVVSALQDAGGHPLSRYNKLTFGIRLHVVGVRTVVRTLCHNQIFSVG